MHSIPLTLDRDEPATGTFNLLLVSRYISGGMAAWIQLQIMYLTGGRYQVQTVLQCTMSKIHTDRLIFHDNMVF